MPHFVPDRGLGVGFRLVLCVVLCVLFYFGFGDGHGRIGLVLFALGVARIRPARAVQPLAKQLSHRLVNGAGVRLFLGDTELRQHVDDGVRGDL